MSIEPLNPSKSQLVKSIWAKTQKDSESNESLLDNISESLDDDLFDLDIDDTCFIEENESNEVIEYRTPKTNLSEKHKSLQIVKLDFVSIPSSSSYTQHVLNLKQSFNFPAPLKSLKEVFTQTNEVDLLKSPSLRQIKRPVSLPPQHVLQKRVQADIKPVNEGNIGDSLDNVSDSKNLETIKPDLEISEFIPPTGVHCVMIKPRETRQATPKVVCKKIPRPQTKYSRRRHIESKPSSACVQNNDVKSDVVLINQKAALTNNKSNLTKKPENLLKYELSSDLSTDGGSDMGGNYQAKLCAVVDKLQDQEWEVCMEGMRGFIATAGFVDWESEVGQKFIPIICRKLIDFFKSPRSNLCRTACQTAGEFFVLARSTKRPEFDEMVDLLLCKTSDPNRFIQKDAYIALEKMATHICVHHSVRAVCAKGPEHKNSIVRATTARLIYIICKKAGVEQIVGSDSNPRTRKRVLSNLAKFLMDKNVETRRHAEKICKLLKPHKFFHEYFFKDVENNQKMPLRKILNSLEAK